MSFGRRLVKARQQQPLEEDDDDATDINEEGPSGGQVIDDADSKLTYFPPGAWEPFSNLDSKVWKDGTVHGSSVVGAGVRFSVSGNALRVVGAITNEPTTLSLALSPVSSTSSPPRRFRYTSPALEPGRNEFNHTFFLIDSLPTNEWTAELRWVEGSRVWLDWVEVIPGGPLTLPSTTTLTSTSSTSASATSTNASAEPTDTGVAVGAVSANKIGAIAGGVTASIIFLLTLLFFLILCLRRRRRERDYKDNPRSYEEMAEAPAPAGPNEGGGGGISVRMQLPGRVKVKKQVILQRDPSASSSGSGSTASSLSSLAQAPVASTSLPNPHPPAVAASSAGAHEGSPCDTVLSSSLGTEPPLSPLPRYSNLGYGAGLQYSEDKKQRKSTLESHDETEETDAGIMLMYTPPSPPPMPSPSPPLRSASPETPLPSAIARAPPPPRPPPRKVNFTATSTQAEGKKVRVLPQTPWNEPSLVAVSALTPRVRSPPAPPLAVHSAGKTPPFPVYATRGPHAAMMSPPPPKLAKPKRYRLSLTGISSIHTTSPNVSPDDDTSMAGVGTFTRGGSGKEVPERGHTEEVLRALNPPPVSRR